MEHQVLAGQEVAPISVRPWRDERKRLGRSVWLLFLLRSWRSPSDMLVRSGDSIRAEELAQALGIGERQARRDLQRLRRAGYVELQNTGRGYRVRVLPAPGCLSEGGQE